MPKPCRVLPIVLAALAIQANLGVARAASNSRQSQTKKIEQRHWSFEPVRLSSVPGGIARDRARTPIDALILRRLEAQSLTFSPTASRVRTDSPREIRSARPAADAGGDRRIRP